MNLLATEKNKVQLIISRVYAWQTFLILNNAMWTK